MLEILILSLVLSLDALSFGIAFGVRNIRLPKSALLAISATGLITIAAAMTIGNRLSSLLPYCDVIGSFLLIGMGMWICADCKKENINMRELLDNPQLSDMNKSGSIETPEAVVIGVTLSLDSAAAAMGTGMAGLSFFLLPICVMAMQLLFLLLGIYSGKKIKPNIQSKYIAVISGFIIVMLGLYQLLPTFV